MAEGGTAGWRLLFVLCAILLAANGIAEANPGGLRPAAHLSPTERADFALGQALFVRPWASGRSSSSSSDGLGPLFNARSCADCHIDGGRSNSLVRPHVEAPNTVLAVVADLDPHPILGRQLQERASPGLAGEGTRQVAVERSIFTYPDGDSVRLSRPRISVTIHDATLAAGEVDFAPRIAPATWTSAAIEAVPEEQILAWADPDDLDGDGISGRVRRVFSLQVHDLRAGRYGWKATAAALEDQVANAFATDMGLSNRLIRADHGDCTSSQAPCFQAAAYADDPQEEVEVRDEIFDLIVAHSRGLATPAFAGDESLHEGGTLLFDAIGCSDCHRRSYDEAHVQAGTPPFTDLLLHDLGPGLADTRQQGSIGAAEWRTASLLGLGQTLRSNPLAGFLHDGRALTVEEAILWHDGEARRARDAFTRLDRAERAVLLDFLQRL